MNKNVECLNTQMIAEKKLKSRLQRARSKLEKFDAITISKSKYLKTRVYRVSLSCKIKRRLIFSPNIEEF